MVAIHQSVACYDASPELMQDQPLNGTGVEMINHDHIRAMRFANIAGFRRVYRELEEAMLACGQCCGGQRGVIDKALKPIANTLMATSRRKRIGGDHGNPSRRFAAADENEFEDEISSGEEYEFEEDESQEDYVPDASDFTYGSDGWEGDSEEDEELSTLRPTEFLGKPQTIQHLPKSCVAAYQLRDPPSKVRMRKFHLQYDDYASGPTVEESLEIYRQLITCLENEKENFMWVSMMLRFRDHGYRLLPNSLDQFYLSNPSARDQLSHFFPTPPLDVIDDWKARSLAIPELEDLLAKDGPSSLPDTCITGDDLVEWGLEELLAHAGPERSVSSVMAFVMGRADVGRKEKGYIRLNVMKDRVRPSRVTISMDIDSVIWLTRRLKFKGAFNLHTSPYRKEYAPIHTSNHLYVELLWPRLDEDVAKSRISSGVQHVPVSNLPNTHFATFGRVEGAATVAVVFPRMKHRYPLGRHCGTKLPEEVELQWLKNVVYEAVRRLDEKGLKPYLDFTYDDTKWKHAGAQETTLVFTAQHLELLQDHIDDILQEHAEDPSYECFLSYFFVLEIRGIKLSTSSDNVYLKDPWNTLVANYPAFDWEYMEDTENGELLMDVGFGFHPSGEVPMVGFWKMDALRLGFDYGGYTQGTSHSACTISSLGGINAEMSLARRLNVHIAYRQAYNLAYEVIRGKLTRERTGFFSAVSAYQQKDDYRRNVEGVINAFLRNRDKSFGVRDEYRCRVTVRRLFELLVEKVRLHQVREIWSLMRLV